MKYRSDIDGLRAIAVVPVVFYHANVVGFSGGFIGVDVFFVISGFLITTIIKDEVEARHFSIVGFYERRARRILPALLAVMVASIVVGWFMLAPVDYAHMAWSIMAALLFVSNVWFWKNSGGYFDGATDYLPMLHTWSLAVEEQFYIVFPLLLILIYRTSQRLILPVIVSAVAVSLVLSVWAMPRMPSASFYLLPTRFWELGLGALLALGLLRVSVHQGFREGAAVVGLLAIMVPIFVYDSATNFPGLTALPPVFGAALIIWAGMPGSTLVGRVLSFRPVVFIGLLSYSLYLWHWPIMAFCRERLFTVHFSALWQVATVVLSFLAAWISWRFIERPFRSREYRLLSGRGRIFGIAAASMVFIGSFSYAVVSTSGAAAARFSTKDIRIMESAKRHLPAEACFGNLQLEELCIFGDTDSEIEEIWMLWGDSHAKSLLPALDALARSEGKKLLFIGAPSCPPLVGVGIVDDGREYLRACPEVQRRALSLVETQVDMETLFVAARWPVYIEGVRMTGESESVTVVYKNGSDPRLAGVHGNAETVQQGLIELRNRVVRNGGRFVMLGTVPELSWNVAQRLEASILYDQPLPQPMTIDAVERRQELSDMILKEVAQYPETTFIPLSQEICRPECPTHNDAAAFYRDNSHLTFEGAVTLVSPIVYGAFAPRKTDEPPSSVDVD
jgi:peptidoglycan/LPS O-acetylase OafA/YrhL